MNRGDTPGWKLDMLVQIAGDANADGQSTSHSSATASIYLHLARSDHWEY